MCLCDTQVQQKLAFVAHFGVICWKTSKGLLLVGNPVILWNNYIALLK